MAPKLYHKKSKTGCLRCRTRRVKCDEVRPFCGPCRRHGVECRYGVPGQSMTRYRPDSSLPTKRTDSPSQHSPSTALPYREDQVPESRTRRMLELRLLYHYINSTCYTLDAGSPPEPAIWKDALIPRFAFTSDAMLYSIFALSAQHISLLNPSDTEAAAASLEYLSMALPLHRHDVNTLSKSNADLVCLTGALLRLLTFATLSSRPITPYTPPMPFLLQARGSSAIFQSVYAFVRDDPDSIAKYMLDRAGYRQRDVAAGELPFGINQSHRRTFQRLLHRSEDHVAKEPWSGDIERAYKDTLAYLGAVQSLSAAGSPVNTSTGTTTNAAVAATTNTTTPSHTPTGSSPSTNLPNPAFRGPSRLRRLILFPSLCPQSYIDLVAQRRPRALVILAQYFALLAEFEDVWWVGKMMGREVRGVLDWLKEEEGSDGHSDDEERKIGDLNWERGMVRMMIDQLEHGVKG